jgi:hypothetical protein
MGTQRAVEGAIRPENDAANVPNKRQGTPTKPSAVKLTALVAPHQLTMLRNIAEKRGVTMTEVLRHAIYLEDALQQEVEAGGKIFVEEGTGARKQLMMIGI